MIPQIQLDKNKTSYSYQEVKQITDEITEAYCSILKYEVSKYKFAKIVSYLSLSVALVLLFKEVFFK